MTDRERRIWVRTEGGAWLTEPVPQGTKVIGTPNKIPEIVVGPQQDRRDRFDEDRFKPVTFRYVTSYLEVFDDEVEKLTSWHPHVAQDWANLIVQQNEDRICKAVGGDFVVKGVNDEIERGPWVR